MSLALIFVNKFAQVVVKLTQLNAGVYSCQVYLSLGHSRPTTDVYSLCIAIVKPRLHLLKNMQHTLPQKLDDEVCMTSINSNLQLV
jgi:hypothetical protein